MGGSRFWRPTTAGVDRALAGSNVEGVWVKEGGSLFWRRKAEKPKVGDGWKEARRGAPLRKRTEQSGVAVSNRFSVLETEAESEGEQVGHLVIGDSRVRPLRRTFCGKRDRCVVKPGARVADLLPVVEAELGSCSPDVVVVQVGVNDIGPRRSVALMAEYRSLLQRLASVRKPVLVTGILPRAAGEEWASRALALNHSVRSMCAVMGLHYVDLWDRFYGDARLYARDGLHLSEEGTRVLGAAYRSIIQGN